MLTAGLVLSRVKLNVAVLVSPARSVWVAVSVCAPSARPLGTKLQVPVLPTVAVPSVVSPSLMMTAVLASPTQTDLAGDTRTATLSFTLDKTRPAVNMALVSDTGSSATDKITSNPAVRGHGDANTRSEE